MSKNLESEAVCTLNVGNGEGVSRRGRLNIGSAELFFTEDPKSRISLL